MLPDGLDVGLVTCAAHFRRERDDRLLLEPALAALGLRAAPVVWDDPAVDWAALRVCVVRSAWDYHTRRAAFLAWVARAGSHTALWNPPALLEWNTHKHYLRDLAARGVPTVPTAWLAAGHPANLAGILAARGWARAVIKPAVGASAVGALLVEVSAPVAGQAHLDTWLPDHDMLVQPFLPTVGTTGERSLMFVDGALSHAVRRPAMLGDAANAGAEAQGVEAAPDEVALGTTILRAVGEPTLYARVDLLRDPAGRLLLMELELVEPSLFLHFAPAAATLLAQAIARKVAALPPISD